MDSIVSRDWLSYLTALSQVATPVLVLLLTAVGWRLRQKIERRIELEKQLRDERVEAYNLILEPFIIILMPDAAWEHGRQNKGKDKMEIAVGRLLSLEYRKIAFKLALIGSDPVVRAYNDLMQHFYTTNVTEENALQNSRQIMTLLGTLLLQIRRSMGNEDTNLSSLEMLEWFMKDARRTG